jgi:hypothetical protein
MHGTGGGRGAEVSTGGAGRDMIPVMSAAGTLLATAAMTVAAVAALKAVRRRIIAAEKRVEAVRKRQERRRAAPVLDLEADAADGTYKAKPAALRKAGRADPIEAP